MVNKRTSDSVLQIKSVLADQQRLLKKLKYNYDLLQKLVDGLEPTDEKLESRTSQPDDDVQIMARCSEIQHIIRSVQKINSSRIAVLIQGENGTGKQLLARFIHHSNKDTNSDAFLSVDCSEFSEEQLEREMFGSESAKNIGEFAIADKGTIYFDHIEMMSLPLQARLLGALQEKTALQARLICATPSDLEKLMQAKKFREDLFYKISISPIELPPLRSRPEDISLLTAHFATRYAKHEQKDLTGVSSDAIKALKGYRWPGNIPELKHIIQRAVLMCNGPVITLEELPSSFRTLLNVIPKNGPSKLHASIEEVEEQALRKTLAECDGNISLTAKKLGIGRATIYRKAKKYGINLNN